MTNEELMNTISGLEATVNGVTRRRPQLNERLDTANASARYDPHLVANIKQEMRDDDETIVTARERIAALRKLLAPASEVAAARTEAAALIDQAAAARLAFTGAWARLQTMIGPAVEAALAVHNASMTMRQCASRVDHLRKEYALALPKITEPPTPDVREMKLISASADVLQDVATRQITGTAEVIFKSALAELTHA